MKLKLKLKARGRKLQKRQKEKFFEEIFGAYSKTRYLCSAVLQKLVTFIMNAISLNYLWQLIKTLDKSDQDWLADKLIESRKESAEITSEVRDRKFLDQLWALPLDDSKTAEQKIKEVEDNRQKGIVREITYVK